MKKLFTAVLAMCMLFCGTLTVTAGAVTLKTEETAISANFIEITPFASEHLKSWSPLLSKSMYGANIGFNGTYSGSVTVELHNTSGKIASFSELFTNRTSIAPVTSRTTASGTYKIVIKVTISGTTTTRESLFINL